jgi:hypothetical protein
MISQITNALANGITPDDILNYLLKKFPSHAGKIKSALSAGASPDQILRYISGDRGNEDKPYPVNTEHADTRKREIEQSEKENRTALNAGLIGAGSLVAPAAIGAIGRALPSSVTQLAPQMMQQLQGMLPNQNQTSQNPPVNVPPTAPQVQSVSPTLPQGNAPVQAQRIPNIGEVLNKYPGFIQKVQDLRNSGNDPTSISAYFRKFNAKQSAKLEKETGQPLEKIVEDYISKTPIQSSVKPLDNAGKSLADIAKFKVGDIIGTRHGTATISQLNDKTFELKYENGGVRSGPIDSFKHELASAKQEEKQPIAKADTVLTPDGLGEVVANRNGKSIVEVDGKKHQIEDKKILKPPKEAAVEALELIKSFTPEQQRSTHHMLNSYDEEEKKGFFVFHNGSAYVVDDISPEEYKELSEEIEQAKTTGETVIGKWASGEGSRGAGYNKIVKGVKDRKVVPELKKKFRKLKVGYNLLAEWQKLLGEHEKDLRSQRNQASE